MLLAVQNESEAKVAKGAQELVAGRVPFRSSGVSPSPKEQSPVFTQAPGKAPCSGDMCLLSDLFPLRAEHTTPLPPSLLLE